MQWTKLVISRDELPCKVLQATAAEGCKLGLIEKHGGKWTLVRAEKQAVQASLVHELYLQKYGQPSPYNNKVVRLLRVRLSRWANDEHQKEGDSKKALNLLWHYSKLVPPCVCYASLTSLCYGWLTDRRLRQFPIRECVFKCCSPGNGDDFCHYAECPTLWQAYKRLGLLDGYVGLNRMRLLLLEGEGNIPLRMTFLHAAMVSVHKLRGPHSHLANDLRERYIRTNFRDTVSRSPMLKKAFNELRSRHGLQNPI